MTAPATRTATIDAQAFVDCDGCTYPVEVDEDDARGCGPVWCLLCRAMGLADAHEAADAVERSA